MMPRCAKSRPTETRLNVILNLSLINLATISRVHNAEANFICSGFFCVTVSDSFASGYQRSTSALAHPGSADARTKASLSTHRSRHAGSAPATIDRRPVQPQNAGNTFGAFARLNLAHDAFAHRFQCPVIQSARIIVSHASSESRTPAQSRKMSSYLRID